MRHPKFMRLARALGDAARARGHLEILWEVGYEAGDPTLGTPDDVEAAAQWIGNRGVLFEALRDAGGGFTFGFIDQAEKGGPWCIHDLFDHAPEFVTKRMRRETERMAKGLLLSNLRAEAGRKGAESRWSMATVRRLPSSSMAKVVTPALAPAPAPARALAPAHRKKKIPDLFESPPMPEPVHDPRHAPLVKALTDAAQRQDPGWKFAKRAAKSVTQLLALGEPAEVLARWERALASNGYPKTRQLWELVTNWGHFGANGATKKELPDVRKGMVRAEDMVGRYGEGGSGDVPF